MSSHRKSRGDRRAASPQTGGAWLYGSHAVAAAIANPNREIHRLLGTKDALGELDVKPGVSPEVVDRRGVESVAGPHAPHQGLAALCAPLPALAIENAIEAMAPGRPIVLLDQVTDPQNVGAVLRSACAFNAAAVVMQDRHAPPETGALAKAASGALDIVPIVRVTNLVRAMEATQAAGAWAIGLAGEADMTLAEAIPAGRPVLIALGAEGAGLRRLTRERCDSLAKLPISDAMESLNVSAAAAVGLYQIAATQKLAQ